MPSPALSAYTPNSSHPLRICPDERDHLMHAKPKVCPSTPCPIHMASIQDVVAKHMQHVQHVRCVNRGDPTCARFLWSREGNTSSKLEKQSIPNVVHPPYIEGHTWSFWLSTAGLNLLLSSHGRSFLFERGKLICPRITKLSHFNSSISTFSRVIFVRGSIQTK